jgi:pretoxin HINT domain-containing protein
MVKLTVDVDGANGDKTGTISATDGHPFWAPDLHRWVKAEDLKAGSLLQTGTGTYVQVTATKKWTAQNQEVRNLTVDGLHTFYVAAGAAVLVHNCDDLFDAFGVRPGHGLDLDTPSGGNGRSFITYAAEDAEGNVQYVGRASGKGSPMDVLKGRLARGHHIFDNHSDLSPRVIDVQGSMEASKGAEEFFMQGYLQRGANLSNSPSSPPLGFSRAGRGAKSVQMMDAFFEDLFSRG